jgi:hypothetical protein
MTLRDLAIEQEAAGDSKGAAENLGEAIRILTQLAERYPDNTDYAQQLESARQAGESRN